jgi:hypothetical protein
MISVTITKELPFLSKSEIKGYGVTHPVGGRILESANALHVHIQRRALPIELCTPILMSRMYETPIHQTQCTQNKDKNECENKARVLLSSNILPKQRNELGSMSCTFQESTPSTYLTAIISCHLREEMDFHRPHQLKPFPW